MNVFISQPMKNRNEKDIKSERKSVMSYIKKLYKNEEVKEINSFFEMDVQSKNTPLRMLGMSLELLAEADIAVFVDGWSFSRCCKIEHDAAKAYGIKILDLDD